MNTELSLQNKPLTFKADEEDKINVSYLINESNNSTLTPKRAKLFLCFINHRAVKKYGREGV
jgi:hypothetical protein